MQDSFKIKGDVVLKTVDKTGNVTKTIEIPNLIVASGKAFLASRMAGNTAARMEYIAVGLGGNTAAQSSQTALVNEIARANVSTIGGTVSGNTVSFSATFADGVGEGNLSEAGIFNASANGTMLCRTVFPDYQKVSGEALTVSWTISII